MFDKKNEAGRQHIESNKGKREKVKIMSATKMSRQKKQNIVTRN